MPARGKTCCLGTSEVLMPQAAQQRKDSSSNQKQQQHTQQSLKGQKVLAQDGLVDRPNGGASSGGRVVPVSVMEVRRRRFLFTSFVEAGT